jgi:Tol biopolymer transport system component
VYYCKEDRVNYQSSTRALALGRRLLSVSIIASLGCAALIPATTPETDALLNLGGLILFENDAVTASNPEGDSEIYVVRPNGTGLKQLTRNAGDDGDPSWSPDGKRIVFASTRDGVLFPGDDFPVGEIYVMRADGSNQTRITNDQADDYYPEWSPDGRRIVFNSNRHDVYQRYLNIYTMDPDGSDVIRVTTSPELIDDWRPGWSPDGRQIVFERRDYVADDTSEIYVIGVDGSGEQNLTNNSAARDAMPAWSPRGNLIAFASNRDAPGGNYFDGDIYVMEPDGSNPRRLTNTTESESFPQWSPDGSRIAFNRFVESTDHRDIFVMRANGSGVTQVTDDPGFIAVSDWGKKGLLGILGRDTRGKDGGADGKNRHGKQQRDTHRGDGKRGSRR